MDLIQENHIQRQDGGKRKDGEKQRRKQEEREGVARGKEDKKELLKREHIVLLISTFSIHAVLTQLSRYMSHLTP